MEFSGEPIKSLCTLLPAFWDTLGMGDCKKKKKKTTKKQTGKKKCGFEYL